MPVVALLPRRRLFQGPSSHGVSSSWVHAKRCTGRPYKSTIHRIEGTVRLTGAHVKNWAELAQEQGFRNGVVHGLPIEVGTDFTEERGS